MAASCIFTMYFLVGRPVSSFHWKQVRRWRHSPHDFMTFNPHYFSSCIDCADSASSTTSTTTAKRWRVTILPMTSSRYVTRAEVTGGWWCDVRLTRVLCHHMLSRMWKLSQRKWRSPSSSSLQNIHTPRLHFLTPNFSCPTILQVSGTFFV